MKNAKILFYGPADTADKKELNLSHYNYMIITNNMINMLDKLVKGKPKLKVILFSNKLFATNYHKDIVKRKHLLSDIWVSTSNAFRILSSLMPEKNIRVLKRPEVNRIPLGLSWVLSGLENTNFSRLYITGVTFYDQSIVKATYTKGYAVPEAGGLDDTKRVHDLDSNKVYLTKSCLLNPRIKLCRELQLILSRLDFIEKEVYVDRETKRDKGENRSEDKGENRSENKGEDKDFELMTSKSLICSTIESCSSVVDQMPITAPLMVGNLTMVSSDQKREVIPLLHTQREKNRLVQKQKANANRHLSSTFMTRNRSQKYLVPPYRILGVRTMHRQSL